MSKLRPIPDQMSVGQCIMIWGEDRPHLDHDTCQCGYPLWMHDRKKEWDGEGRYYYRTICPDDGTVLPPDG